MGRIFGRVMVVVALALLFMPVVLAGAQGSDEAIAITSPKEGASISSASTQITGTAPPSTIVKVVITDTDTGRAGVAHQPNGKVEGTVTAGNDGSWAYVPQHQLVPGPFAVEAVYTNDQNQEIESKTINFVVLSEGGSSVRVSSSLLRRLVIWGGLAIALIVLIVVFWTRRKRRMDLKRIAKDTETIEEELEHTVEELTRTNEKIAELNKNIAKQKGQNGPG
jgi:hypothetical protein